MLDDVLVVAVISTVVGDGDGGIVVMLLLSVFNIDMDKIDESMVEVSVGSTTGVIDTDVDRMGGTGAADDRAAVYDTADVICPED